MSAAKIHGAEFPLLKIFSNDFNFNIPLYQRPYSWTTEQAGELLDDLLSFIGSDAGVDIKDLSPYFLGSIVLIKAESIPDAEVVDGQQRLTTLTILLSALRHTIADGKLAEALTGYLYEEGDPLVGTNNRYRLTLRERDAEFFRKWVQDPQGIGGLHKLDSGQLPDSQRNIRANALHILESLTTQSEEQRVRLARFVVKNCLLVVVSTPDLDSAYRIFSILNDRGLDLSHSDILKSEIIGRIPTAQQEAYTEKWEDAEEGLGRDPFAELFAHTRMIFRKQKAKETILKEFRQHVIKAIDDSCKLIDDVLTPYAEALATIRTTGYESATGADAVNQMLRWLGRIDNTDWLPPAIRYLADNRSDPKALLRFFVDLERLAAFLMISRRQINERIDRYGKLIDAIDTGKDLYAEGSPLQLTEAEEREFLKELDGDVYGQVSKRRLYILLRLDSALSDASASYDHAVISIEHVLPQNPPADSKWCEWFPSKEMRAKWVHRLGNLLLLNHKKNSSASNYGFEKKKKSYFMKGGVSPFPLTSQALKETEWTLGVVERRHNELVRVLKGAWRLTAELPPDEVVPEIDTAQESSSPASFHDGMIPTIERKLGKPLAKRSRSIWATADDSVVVACLASKYYPRSEFHYWFGLSRATKETLEQHPKACCAFGLGDPSRILFIPFDQFVVHLLRMNTTTENGQVRHWHVCLRESTDSVEVIMPAGIDPVDVGQHLIDPHK